MMEMRATATLEWGGKEYELLYTFDIVRHIRSEGVNIPRIFREVQKTPEAIVDYGDEIAIVIAALLRRAGCPDVKAEDVWRNALADSKAMQACWELFAWVALQHFFASPNAPKPKARKTTRKTSVWTKCSRLLAGAWTRVASVFPRQNSGA